MSGQRAWEDAVCTGIMLALGTAAGAGSFAHVRDVAAAHGQPGWLSYVIAGSVDLMAVGSGLEIRRRRRQRVPARWPVFTLLLGVGMTLAANLDTAGPGPWGAAMAVWCAVAFLAVAGLFETRVRRPVPTMVPTEDQDGTIAVLIPGPAGDEEDQSSDGQGPDTPHEDGTAEHKDGQQQHGRPAVPAPDTADLLLLGRAIAADLAHTGRPLSRATLIDGVRARGRRISTGRATELLRQLRTTEPAA